MRRKRFRPHLFDLEARIAPANVTTYHNDLASTGVNSQETILTRTNVNSTTFGKVFQVNVDGQVYAQPLVVQNVNITTGAFQGVHDVVFVATEHNSLYAIDASDPTGKVLWQRNFMTTGLPGATIVPVPQAETASSDITVEIGITGTPVIDPATGTLYLVAKTQETVGTVPHWIQRLYAVNIQNGTDRVAPYVISDTTRNAQNVYTNLTQIYVYGTGHVYDLNGNYDRVVDPYNGTGQFVVQFNALRQHQRAALTLVNGSIYVAWASHGDNTPVHGWVVGFNKTDLHLTAVINTTPNGGLGGIWMAGGALSYDGTYFYCETGNGTFTPYNGSSTTSNPIGNAPGPLTGLDANGFPLDNCYGDSFLKLGMDPDPLSSPSHQNKNGWGLKIVDYFTPYNEQFLDERDLDVGSAAPLVLPDVGNAAHPRMLIGSGKEGVIYLMDRDNMGKFGLNNNVVQTTSNQLSGSLDTAAFFNNTIYYVEGYGGTAKTFPFVGGLIDVNGMTRSLDSFSFAGSTPSISSNGTANGIVWDVDRGLNELRAYSTDSYAIQLYNSNQAAGNRDMLGAAVKFQVPTVANGHVYVASGTGNPNNFLVMYGLLVPPSTAPAAPTGLSATTVSGSQINLSWTRNDTTPNIADSYLIEQSPDGSTGWTQVAVTGYAASSYAVGGLNTSTTYFFRVRAHNVIGNSAYTNTANATTSGTLASISFPSGFATGTSGVLSFNGGASVVGSALRVTSSASSFQARSIFSINKLDVTHFITTFDYLTPSNDSVADGFTFTIQRNSISAVGSAGGSLGYEGIPTSVAIKLDLFPNAGESSSSTGMYLNGVAPTSPSVDMTGTIDIHAGHTLRVTLDYSNGTTLVQTVRDLTTNQVFTTSYSLNIGTAIGGGTAYVGFTGGTGVLTSTQDVLNWTFLTVVPPGLPTSLSGTATGYTAGSTEAVPIGAHLSWTAPTLANSASAPLGYKIERRTSGSPNYTQVGTTAAGVTTFDDTGLAAQTTYVYRIRAYNNAGDGAYSATVNVVVPGLAPTPTNGVASVTTTTSLTLQWTDNSNNEDGYQIFRSTNFGTFSLLISLPVINGPAPTTFSWTDTNLTPGTRYDYHVQAFNLSGYSDFSGITTATRALAPSSLNANVSAGTGNLSWTPPTGANSYVVYRATASAGPYTAIANGVVANNYADTSAIPGTSYYRVTAVTLGGESAVSNTATAVNGSAPTVQPTTVNDGNAQRSRVYSLQVPFSTQMTFAGAMESAFTLTGPFGTVPVAVTLTSTSPATVAKLTFPAGNSVEFGSLKDGRYQLLVRGNQLSANGIALDGDGNGTAGGDATINFHRLYGDSNGDATVGQVDYNAFRLAYVAGPSLVFDFQQNNEVDLADYNAFRLRYGTSV